MDEQKDNQDMIIGFDGALTEDDVAKGLGAQEAASDEAVQEQATPATEPMINTVAPPPSDETLMMPEETNHSGGVVQAPKHQQYDEATAAEAPTTNETLHAENAQSSKEVQRQTPHEHRNNKKLAVIMTLLVAFALAGGTIYVYLAAQDNAEPTQSVPQNTAPVEENPTEDETVEELTGPDEEVEPGTDTIEEVDPEVVPETDSTETTTEL